MKKQYLAISASIISAVCSFAQAPAAVTAPMVLPGPLGTPGQQRLAYYDLKTNEAVAVIPFPGGGSQQFRVPLHNNVAPVVQVDVVKTGLEFTYVYRLSNGSTAKSPLAGWAVEVADDGSTGLAAGNAVGAPSGWHTLSPAPASVNTPGRIRPTISLSWALYDPTKTDKASGVSFTLQSKLLPGVVWSFAKGVVPNEPDQAAINALPAATAASLRDFLTPAVDGVTVMTIGPKFAADDPKELVAAEFFQAIVLLAGPNGESRFVSAAKDALSTYMSQPDPARSPLKLEFLTQAGTPFEMDIANAMRIAFSK